MWKSISRVFVTLYLSALLFASRIMTFNYEQNPNRILTVCCFEKENDRLLFHLLYCRNISNLNIGVATFQRFERVDIHTKVYCGAGSPYVAYKCASN